MEAGKIDTYDGKRFDDLDSLREYLKKKGKIRLSDGSERTAEEILKDIDEVRAGREKINVITKEGGLRNLVQKLLRPEENEAIFNKLWPQGLEY